MTVELTYKITHKGEARTFVNPYEAYQELRAIERNSEKEYKFFSNHNANPLTPDCSLVMYDGNMKDYEYHSLTTEFITL